MLTLAQTKSLLNRLQLLPKRKMGQNFLVNSTYVVRSLDWAQVKLGDVVVEIGPGCGTLTTALVAANAQVYAVEKDRVLYAHIAETLPEVELVCDDALQSPVGRYDFSADAYKVVANLPYAIASILGDRILELAQLPVCMVLMVQKEAADRWFSSEGNKQFCPLSIFFQSAYQIENKCTVSKNCFYPQPKVDSVLLHLSRREHPFIFESDCKKLIRDIFVHRRQQIGHVCKSLDTALSRYLLSYLTSRNVPLSSRAESLPVEFWQLFAVELGHHLQASNALD